MFYLFTLCLLSLSQQAKAIEDPLQSIESYVGTIKSYNVFFRVTATNYYKSDPLIPGNGQPGKLIKRESPSARSEYVRQTLSGNNTSYELFDDKQKLISKVHNDGKIDRGISLESSQCFIRTTRATPGFGKDYRETHRQIMMGIPLVEILKRRGNLLPTAEPNVFVSQPPEVRTAMSNYIMTIRLLPEQNMAIGALESMPKPTAMPRAKHTMVNKRFHSLPDGTLVPVESLFCLYTMVDDAKEMKLIGTLEMVVDVLASQWNGPVNESDYQVIFPKGSKVFDDIKKETRIIDEPDSGKK